MAKTKTKYGMLGCIVLFVLLILGNSMRAFAAADIGRVLFISSYSYGWDSVQLQIEGIKQGIDDRITVDYEFMDAKRLGDEVSIERFHDCLAYKIAIVDSYDAVIAGDDAALLFVEKYRDELFPGIPIIFEGPNDTEHAKKLAEDPLVTGITEKLYIKENIELGLHLNPKAEKVVMILDSGVSGVAEKNHFYACAEEYPDLEFEDINVSELSEWDLQLALQKIGDESILIYLTFAKDADGKVYSHKNAVKLVAENANVPVLCLSDDDLGYGFLGGKVMSMRETGKMAAQIASDYINGVQSGVLPDVNESPCGVYIDETVMKKYKIKKSAFPKDTVFINHQENFVERNKEAFALVLVVLIAAGSFGLWALYVNRKKQALLLELQEAKDIMETASLHDFLTGLPNRSKFMADLEDYIAQKHPCTLLMLDIDDFKKINDTYGHNAGDDALKQVAARLKGVASPILTPYRYAGDEFIVILQSNQSKIISKAALDCSQIFDKQFILQGVKTHIYGSIGIATYPQDTDDLEQLIAHADDAMYSVKKNGKNAYAYYKKEDES